MRRRKHKYYRIVHRVQKSQIIMQYLYCIQLNTKWPVKMSNIVDFPC